MRLPIDEDRLRAWIALMRAHAVVVDGLEEELLRERELPLAWHEVLVHLARAPEGRLRMQELADSVLLSKSGLSRLVDRLEAAGYVARESCDADRRGTYAVLTPEGRRVVRAAAPVFVRAFDEHVARHLTDEDVRTLRSVLGKILSGHGKAVEPDDVECAPDVEAGEPASTLAGDRA
ncbi:MAG: MarR family transcriptional regulator [Actinobacteria bacterium]|nr:MarR family transcriptional regulator [Actinomycetota bacterium]